MKRILTSVTMLALVLGASLVALAQQKEKPKHGRSAATQTGKHHVLPATLETT